MGKKLYWIVVIVLLLSGLVGVIYFGLQPRPIPKIKLSQFENHRTLANSLLLRLREEIKGNPVLFFGIQSERPEQIEVLKAFLGNNQEAGMKYDLILADEGLKDIDQINPQEKMATREQGQALIHNIEAAVALGQRVVLVVPSAYSAQKIPMNLVAAYQQIAQKTPLSFTLVDFPRRREKEKDMAFPCVVEGVDETGLGPFGCLLAQTARANYRKRFAPGSFVGLAQQIGLKDFLILYTQEIE